MITTLLLTCLSLPLLATELRIIGGVKVQPDEFPYMVAILGLPNQNLFCGGTLIGGSWVLTAAHCFTTEMRSNISTMAFAWTGATNIRSSNAGVGQRVGIVTVLIHPQYEAVSLENDVALIKLALPIANTSRVVLARSDASQWTTATVMGWGAQEITGAHASEDLMKTSVLVRTNADCAASYGKSISDSMLCAAVDGNQNDACSGDSGGPLVVPASGGGFTQIGLVSHGGNAQTKQICGDANDWGVYTRVTRYQSWIADKIAPDTLLLADPLPATYFPNQNSAPPPPAFPRWAIAVVVVGGCAIVFALVSATLYVHARHRALRDPKPALLHEETEVEAFERTRFDTALPDTSLSAGSLQGSFEADGPYRPSGVSSACGQKSAASVPGTGTGTNSSASSRRTSASRPQTASDRGTGSDRSVCSDQYVKPYTSDSELCSWHDADRGRGPGGTVAAGTVATRSCASESGSDGTCTAREDDVALVGGARTKQRRTRW